MSGTSTTSRYDVAVVSLYLYGRDSLLQILDNGRRFSLAVPELDVVELERELDSSEGLPVASAKEFLAASTFIAKTMKMMRQAGETSWNPEQSRRDARYATARKTLQEKQARRK